MKKIIIWDLDGTIIDSYQNIVDSIEEIFKEKNIHFEKKYIYDYVKENSTYEFILNMTKENNLNYEEIKKKYSLRLKEKNQKVTLFKNTRKVLKEIHDQNDINILYTHKSNSCIEILKRKRIFSFFELVVTSDSDYFYRKPNPKTIDIIKNMYNEKNHIFYYIGDRNIDVMVAKNSKIKSIYFDGVNNLADYSVHTMIDIVKILYNKEG